MNPFPSAREAKEFLIARIVEEARREGVPLSEVERKMLYFSETGWTLPDMMQVSDAFDREYDQNEYEKKIEKLAVSLTERIRKENPEECRRWNDAIRTLGKEDHYILVMVERTDASVRSTSGKWMSVRIVVMVCIRIAVLFVLGTS